MDRHSRLDAAHGNKGISHGLRLILGEKKLPIFKEVLVCNIDDEYLDIKIFMKSIVSYLHVKNI